jgi:hypothetical protein
MGGAPQSVDSNPSGEKQKPWLKAIVGENSLTKPEHMTKKTDEQFLKEIFEEPLEPQNKYVMDLERFGADVCAETLLGIMRAVVDKVTERYGFDQPPSQSHRAKLALDAVENEIRDMVKAKHPLDDDMRQLFRDRRFLKDFLAVHRTVWILEGKPV